MISNQQNKPRRLQGQHRSGKSVARKDNGVEDLEERPVMLMYMWYVSHECVNATVCVDVVVVINWKE